MSDQLWEAVISLGHRVDSLYKRLSSVEDELQRVRNGESFAPPADLLAPPFPTIEEPPRELLDKLKKAITEGKQKKGGVNTKPTTPPPPSPKGQGRRT